MWDQLFFYNRIMPGALRRNIANFAFHRFDKNLERSKFCEDALWQGLPEIAGVLPTRANGDCVLLAFGDAKFVARFAPELLRSLARNSANTHLHLHIFGEGEDESAFGFSNSVQKNLTVTWEKCDVGLSKPSHKVRFYQSMRFVRLAQFLTMTDCSFLAIDIDSVILEKLEPHMQLLQGVDIGLILRPKYYDPGKKILACAFYAAPNRKAADFLKTAATRMLAHLAYTPYTEKLDQRCLYFSFEKNSAGLCIALLPMTLASTETKGATIVSFRGKRKGRAVKEKLYPIQQQV